MTEKQRAPRNRTIRLPEESQSLRGRLASAADAPDGYLDRTFLGDYREITALLPDQFVDLLFLDPPYNLDKRFGESKFSRRSVEDYTTWLGTVLDATLPTLKQNGTVYICGDWLTSASILAAAAERLKVRNRITWEREKGRGAKTNWKNACEDIWFCTNSGEYTFNVDVVKLRRRVIAPYRDVGGEPRDWIETPNGNYRDTYPSNLWTDITVPFWSMSENTDHPTQKSEKLLAKLILASTNPGDVVFDPFLGSGTASAVARKLGRHFVGIEIVEEFALLAEKRIELATLDETIQGYADGVFWERNTSAAANGNRSTTHGAAPRSTRSDSPVEADLFSQ
jgi:site-specific DNA-methyltransferase (adenine-specific)